MSKLDKGLVFIGKEGADQISIRIAGPASADGWLPATLEVRAGPWQGACDASFYKGELARFGSAVDRLHRDLRGSAELRPLEPHIELTLTGDGKGHVAVVGKAQSTFADGIYLAFAFEIDQTELPAIAEALRTAELP